MPKFEDSSGADLAHARGVATQDARGRRFLIVDDEVGVSLAAVLRRDGECVVAKTIAEAERALAANLHFDAMIVDILLPDGNGLDLLATVRGSNGPHAHVPALVITGHLEERHVNAAYDLDAPVIEKPFTLERLNRFLRRACPRQRIEEATREYASHARLTPTESDLLAEYTICLSRDLTASQRGCAPNTLKKHAGSIAQKTGADSLEEAALRVLHEALRN